MRRQAAFSFLLADGDFATGSKEMTSSELELLTSIASSDSAEGSKFWTTCLVVQILSEWGATTSMWLHGCMCQHQTDKERKNCRLKGRRGVQLACGEWRVFIETLQTSSLTPECLKSLSRLRDSGQSEWSEFLMQCFQETKASMVMRARQAWSFWSVLPYSILELARHLIDPNHTESASRTRAKELLHQFDNSASKSEMGFATWNVFGHDLHRRAIKKWSKGQELKRELQDLFMGYSTCLVVMQRLEAKHHLINTSVSRGRAQTPAAVISGLRRMLNKDLTDSSFRRLIC